MRDLHLLRAAICLRAVAPVSRRRTCLLAAFFRRRALRIVQYRTDLLCFWPWQEPLSQRMQYGFELLAIGFTQGSALGAIDDPIQLFYIYVNAPAWWFLLHNWTNKSRKWGVSG